MENETAPKYTIISKWNKPGTRYEKAGDSYTRVKTGERNMAMVTMKIDGQTVTRHISV